jgi:hypothetical protein
MMFTLIGAYYENRMKHAFLNIKLKVKILNIITSHYVFKWLKSLQYYKK